MKIYIFLTLFSILGSSLNAGVPSTLNYQGRVLQNGQPFDGNGHFVFGIYEGSTLLWTNKLPVPSPLNDPAAAIDSSDAKALTVRNGVFNLRLGEGDANNAPVGTDVFFKFDGTQRVRTDVKLKVWFSPAAEGAFTKLEPDISFASVPFAQVAGVAETVMDASVTTVKIAGSAVTNSSIGDGQISGGKLTDSSVSVSKIDATFSQSLVPVGTILPFGGVTPPAGYLMCAGQQYPKATYPQLSAVLNNAFGGDSTNFRIPDFRGRFLRGTDDPDGTGSTYAAAGHDPDVSAASRLVMNTGGNIGNNIGSVQSYATSASSLGMPSSGTGSGTHTHQWAAASSGFAAGNAGTALMYRTDGFPNNSKVTTNASSTAGSHTHTITGAAETRPINANVNYIIKY